MPRPPGHRPRSGAEEKQLPELPERFPPVSGWGLHISDLPGRHLGPEVSLFPTFFFSLIFFFDSPGFGTLGIFLWADVARGIAVLRLAASSPSWGSGDCAPWQSKGFLCTGDGCALEAGE